MVVMRISQNGFEKLALMGMERYEQNAR